MRGVRGHGWRGRLAALPSVIGSVAALLLGSTTAAAPPAAGRGPAPAPAPADRALAECRAAHPHAAARSCLQRLHAARPAVAALCELGRLEEAADQPVAAYEAYQRCVAESPGATAAHGPARGRLAALAPRLGLLLVRADQPGATVSIAGQARGAVGRVMPVVPGSHRLQVDAPGFRPWRDLVTATAGELLEVPVQLVRDATPARPAAPAAGRGAVARRAAPEPPLTAEDALEAEALLERALDAEEGRASADERAAAWCDLFVLDGPNPHRERARGRCAELDPGGEERARRRAAMAARQRGLLAYLDLKRKSEGAKLAVVERFLRDFGALRGERGHDEAVLGVLARATDPLRRRVCGRVGRGRLPVIALTVRAVNERGGLLVGKLFVDGQPVGTVPGTFTVSACVDRLGVALADGPVAWEQAPPRAARVAEVRALFRRYAATADVVQDTTTGRIWQRRASADATTFAGAQRYCQARAGGAFRLPTKAELEGLVERHAPPLVDHTAFPGTLAEGYWTSTAHPGQRYHMWVINFESGEAAGRFVGHDARVRCVK